MYLVQILLPLFSNSGKRFPARYFRGVKEELTGRFRGLTAYNRAPAEGRWEKKGRVQRDEIIVYEVMAQRLEKKWWGSFRLVLEKQFHQSSVVIRAHSIRVL
jgi:hypothetical protein